MQGDKKVSKFIGTYCGFLDFDGIRYWDGRHLQGFKIRLQEKPLESDFRNRPDLQALKNFKIEEAQIQKEKVEEAQRRDAKLRQQFKAQN